MDNFVKAVRKNVEGPVYRTVWENLKVGDVGEPVEIPTVKQMTVQILGDFYSSNVIIEGSLEKIPTEYFELWTPDGVSYKNIVVWFRPRVIGGDEKSNFTVILLARSLG